MNNLFVSISVGFRNVIIVSGSVVATAAKEV